MPVGSPDVSDGCVEALVLAPADLMTVAEHIMHEDRRILAALAK